MIRGIVGTLLGIVRNNSSVCTLDVLNLLKENLRHGINLEELHLVIIDDLHVFHGHARVCTPTVCLVLSQAVHHLLVIVVILFIGMMMLLILSLVVVVIMH